MTRKSRGDWPPPGHVSPPPLQIMHRPGDRGTSDPFLQFKRLARDDGKPYKSAEPRAEVKLLSLLATKAALVVMGCLLVVVFATVLALMVIRAS